MKSPVASCALGALLCLTCVSAGPDPGVGEQKAHIDPIKYRAACPDYKNYVTRMQYASLLGQFDQQANTFPQLTFQYWPVGAPFSETFKVLQDVRVASRREGH